MQVSNVTLLQNYYYQAYATVRQYSDCFVALCPPENQVDGSEFQSFMAGSQYTKVIQDVHRRASGHVRNQELLAEIYAKHQGPSCCMVEDMCTGEHQTLHPLPSCAPHTLFIWLQNNRQYEGRVLVCVTVRAQPLPRSDSCYCTGRAVQSCNRPPILCSWLNCVASPSAQVLQLPRERELLGMVAERVRYADQPNAVLRQEGRPAAGHRRVDPGRCAQSPI